ncbi:MAG TPA: hypothetical protein VIG48_13230 [Jatrophihabitans sp.]|jgi:mRNA-degrading endonuclease YafQ of YafQ-DinJ toxin-antitoxin module
MSHATEQGRKEQAALATIIERLSRRFPELARDDVHHAVHGKYSDFDQASIRDFVTVLVENFARGELENRARQRRA